MSTRKILDCFPFFNETDVLEIRLNELSPIVDRFIIIEAGETYGGVPKPFNLEANFDRFSDFADRIVYVKVRSLEPKCTDRASGREREAFQRNVFMSVIAPHANDQDVVIFSDCDEIPRAMAIQGSLHLLTQSIHRLKQRSYYYNCNTLVDYGHDFASRARVGLFSHVKRAGGFYDFRMFRRNDPGCPAIEKGGWHFSYFGGADRIKTKVAALSPFLSEYKLFGDVQLEADIFNRKDLHHRKCEMPATFEHVSDNDLPGYLLAHREKFAHFFAEEYLRADN